MLTFARNMGGNIPSPRNSIFYKLWFCRNMFGWVLILPISMEKEGTHGWRTISGEREREREREKFTEPGWEHRSQRVSVRVLPIGKSKWPEIYWLVGINEKWRTSRSLSHHSSLPFRTDISIRLNPFHRDRSAKDKNDAALSYANKVTRYW